MNAPYPPDAGLSLTEVLVSVFILALATSAIILTAPERPDPVEASLEQLSADIEHTMDMSMVSGHVMGLDLSRNGYQLVTYRNQVWVPAGKPVRLKEIEIKSLVSPSTDREEESKTPEIRFDPTGIVSPIELVIAHTRRKAVLRVAMNGHIEQEQPSR